MYVHFCLDQWSSRLNRVSLRGWRDNVPPPPADGSLTQTSWQIYIRPQTGPQSAHLWWLAVAKLQAAYSIGSCPMGQTDRRTDCTIPKCPPRAWGMISCFTGGTVHDLSCTRFEKQMPVKQFVQNFHSNEL